MFYGHNLYGWMHDVGLRYAPDCTICYLSPSSGVPPPSVIRSWIIHRKVNAFCRRRPAAALLGATQARNRELTFLLASAWNDDDVERAVRSTICHLGDSASVTHREDSTPTARFAAYSACLHRGAVRQRQRSRSTIALAYDLQLITNRRF